MAKYLVSGGCGFIGSHLVDALVERGDKVCVLDDLSTGKKENITEGIELIVDSITHREAWKRALEGVDGVFHLAAIPSVIKSVEQWHATHEVNAGGTVHLFEEARGLPIVYASSSAIYGKQPNPPFKESITALPTSPYAADKASNELSGQVAWEIYQTPSIGLRLFNVYGPRQDPSSPYSGVISIFTQKINQAQPLPIYGDGKQTRDFIYVSDVVKAFLSAMHHNGGGAHIYNVCTGHPTSLLEMVATFEKLVDNRIETTFLPPRIGEILDSCGDPTHMQKELGIQATISLKEGLKSFLKELQLCG